MSRLGWYIFTFFAVLAVVSFWFSYTEPYDTTDNGAQRSGLTLYNDHMTGCDYLSTWRGDLTPRLGPDGKQICWGAVN